MLQKKNVFFVGLNTFNLEKLRAIRNAERYVFHGLLDPADVLETYEFPIPGLLARSEQQLRDFKARTGGPIDAIATYMDFPVSTMLPILCARFGTRGPSLDSLLKCEHKYWSRLVQREVIPDHIPEFRVFDPFDDQAFGRIDLPLPFWIKPVKASGSLLGFRIHSRDDFTRALSIIRRTVHLLSEPFNFVLSQAKLPPEVARVRGHHFLAESLIGGHQCTLEGYSFRGSIEAFGVVDSIRYPNGVSFARYQYPSTLPRRVRDEMFEITRKLVRHIGFDDSAFNVEYYWDEQSDHIWLLEINTRISQSHSDLFEKVDGASNHQVTVQVACGERPTFPHREGVFPCAAKFFWRSFEGDAEVTRVPSREDIRALEAQVPGVIVHPAVRPGMRLSDLLEQDSYSYDICHLFIGGRDTQELLDRYAECQERLRFELRPLRDRSREDSIKLVG